jgi:putative transposase
VTDEQSVKPCPYMAHGAVLLFPPQTRPGRLMDSGKIYINGWKKSCTIRSSYATPLLLRLCS